MEFHVSRQARDRYQFDLSLFNLKGSVIFPNFHAARVFAQKINQKRDLINFPEKAVRASQINALGLIDEILHLQIASYRQKVNPGIFNKALEYLAEKIGEKSLEHLLYQFAAEFPPLAVYKRENTLEKYLQGETDGISNRTILLEEMIVLWVTNQNPAADPFSELFTDHNLANQTPYPRAIVELYSFFDNQPRANPGDPNLLDLLLTPARVAPHSLFAQLDFMRQNWGSLLSKFLYRLLNTLDFIREEDKPRFTGTGPTQVPDYRFQQEGEPEQFSMDREWMPRLVLLAKNTFVWLTQLSKKYDRPIRHLDDIPEEELDELARSGFTGLWLIGLWERSHASAKIKQMCGNPDAIASAYSLYNYQIADALGGEQAYQKLKERAWKHGIRMASDMVPNHMGIDSPWVAEHPDWFISTDYSPFPAYTFNGENLSQDNRVSIYLEDHYYTRTDASVVFKLVDHRYNQTRYIYHGNDGTSMPWNDTAQLNYLKPEVREAIIQTILDVARKFPIIRFDAAMTLAKRHYQRLWYPEPGSGGDIPSRAEHGMSKSEFDARMPVEFWREVVDRVAVEAPDTLLLAEAFWLMEGYFVRTLGMHRVYNSAFMNLLRNEENAKYRTILKDILEYEPEILKRFVNFMNNPDERTAVEQFGKGDKYFGVCVLLSTLPGLPMFGHGQFEGFSEKYGMEFYRPLWDESVDEALVARHRREISPLLHNRALFANVDHFLLYDFRTPSGSVNDDVYAYSNRFGSQAALVVYNNKYATTQGHVQHSSGFLARQPDGSKVFTRKSLIEGLDLNPAPGMYTIFRDHITNLEFIRANQDLASQGLYIELSAYQYAVFLDFRQVQDDEWGTYRNLCNFLGGRGVPGIQESLKEILLQPVLTPLNQIIHNQYLAHLLRVWKSPDRDSQMDAVKTECTIKVSNLLDGIQYYTGAAQQRAEIEFAITHLLEKILTLDQQETRYPFPGSRKYKAHWKYLLADLTEHKMIALIEWSFLHGLGRTADPSNGASISLSWVDEWRISVQMNTTHQKSGMDETGSQRSVDIVRIMIAQQDWLEQSRKRTPRQILEQWLDDYEIQRFINMNRYQDVIWYNKENFEEFLWWMALIAAVQSAGKPNQDSNRFAEDFLVSRWIIERLLTAQKTSGFQVKKLLEAA
ncbi:MAG TPA: alpha-amylase family glycosyl hydrolase [Anaerolineaceae bacterium]